MAATLQQVMQTLEPRLKKHRPLARACPQLVLDIAAWLSGLRPVIMLDHAPGATPQQLQQALQPLAQLLPDFRGCILQLEGCCYLANSRLLLDRLEALAAGPGTSSSWPAVVAFSESQPVLAQPQQCQELQQQLQTLAREMRLRVRIEHEGPPVGFASTALFTATHATQRRHGSGALPVIDLGHIQGLPAMPALNGVLLGYPAVYWVNSLEEAAVASRQLSAAQLRLHKVVAAAPVGTTGNCVGTLLSFTMPGSMCDAAFDSKVQQVVDRIKAVANGCVHCDVLIGTVKLQEGQQWDIQVKEEAVQSCGVSL